LNQFFFDPSAGYINRIISQAKSLLDGEDVSPERIEKVVKDIKSMAEDLQKI